jgi:hypothetical protein
MHMHAHTQVALSRSVPMPSLAPFAAANYDQLPPIVDRLPNITQAPRRQRQSAPTASKHPTIYVPKIERAGAGSAYQWAASAAVAMLRDIATLRDVAACCNAARGLQVHWDGFDPGMPLLFRNPRACTHAHTRTRARTLTHARARAHTHTHTPTQTNHTRTRRWQLARGRRIRKSCGHAARTHTRTHPSCHMHTHTHPHTHIHIHTHTHARSLARTGPFLR